MASDDDTEQDTSDDGREVAASIFERTAKLAATLADRTPGAPGAVLGIAASIAGVVAQIIRDMGVDDAGEAIAGLVEYRDDGRIGGDELAADDAAVADRIGELYRGPD